jgi:hypothetical protein
MCARYDETGVHRALLDTLIARHESSYARHWADVFLHMQAESAAIRRANREAEAVEADEVATLARLERELTRLGTLTPGPPVC